MNDREFSENPPPMEISEEQAEQWLRGDLAAAQTHVEDVRLDNARRASEALRNLHEVQKELDAFLAGE